MRREGWVWLLGVLVAVVLAVGLAAAAAEVRIGIVTDVHFHDRDSPAEGTWMAKSAERLGAFVAAMNAWPADVVIELGDFVNGWVVLGVDPGDPARIPGILKTADEVLAGFSGPRYHVIGNHDLYNLSKDQYREVLGLDRTYGSLDVEGVHVVLLDVQFKETGEDLANTFTGVKGFVPDEEMDWLRADLAATALPTIVCVHQRLDSERGEGRDVANADEVTAILAVSGVVVAVFQGHDHENGHTESDGIHYLTFEALVDQGTPPSWARVTVDPEARTIVVRGEGGQANWDLAY